MRLLHDHDHAPALGVEGLRAQPVPLTADTLDEALRALVPDVAAAHLPPTEVEAALSQLVEAARPVVALADLLASAEAEVVDAREIHGRGRARTWPPAPGQTPIQLWLLDTRPTAT
ncbi:MULTISPECIES: hypothetical protein [Actinosynnema]|uniref:hypothetical protein n=1 Tax=Actinosynnema TaxID=40566 RepID=UPI0020A4FF3C|nr:hypothetical protein [Actinosynnema pretiosum]MCP2097359.1 hypothetical protein [Actinosynnema pretiosum]